MSQSATATGTLNTSRASDSTTSLGHLFQYLTTLSMKKFFLMFNKNLPWNNLRPFPLILSVVNGDIRQDQPQLWSLGSITNYWLTDGCGAIHHHSVGLASQPRSFTQERVYPPKPWAVRRMMWETALESLINIPVDKIPSPQSRSPC